MRWYYGRDLGYEVAKLVQCFVYSLSLVLISQEFINNCRFLDSLTVTCMKSCRLRAISCQVTQRLERATTLGYRLKPLWHIHFVSVSLFIFLVNFFSFLLHCFSVRALGTDTLFAKFWLEGRLVRLGPESFRDVWLLSIGIPIRLKYFLMSS